MFHYNISLKYLQILIHQATYIICRSTIFVDILIYGYLHYKCTIFLDIFTYGYLHRYLCTLQIFVDKVLLCRHSHYKCITFSDILNKVTYIINVHTIFADILHNINSILHVPYLQILSL